MRGYVKASTALTHRYLAMIQCKQVLTVILLIIFCGCQHGGVRDAQNTIGKRERAIHSSNEGRVIPSPSSSPKASPSPSPKASPLPTPKASPTPSLKISPPPSPKTSPSTLPNVSPSPRPVISGDFEFLELTPALKDELDREIPESTNVKLLPRYNDMREQVDAVTSATRLPDVAYRNLRVRIRRSKAGDIIKWRIFPLFKPAGSSEPRFRGDLPQEHLDGFEATGGGYGFQRVSKWEARSQLNEKGETAIRVNLPPIGFNKAKIRLEIEKRPSAIAEIAFEVPAVLVIDPGHGGNDGLNPSGAMAKPSGIYERAMTLDFGVLLRDRLQTLRAKDQRNLRIYMTRTENKNSPLSSRAKVARNVGADVLLSLHFNGIKLSGSARGVEIWYDSTGNYNKLEDENLAQRVYVAAYQAIAAIDPDAKHYNRGVGGKGLGVLSDDSIGNSPQYHPVRAALLEVEFIDFPAVDRLLNTSDNHLVTRQSIMNAVADALIDDLLNNPQ